MTHTNRDAVYFHTLYWMAAYGVWLMLTMSYHPNWTLRLIATALLVGGSAFYACCLTPRAWSGWPWIRSGMALIGCGVTTALMIHVIYDMLLGPDPRRFPLANNMVMDTAFVLFNTAIAALVAWILSRLTSKSLWPLFPAPTQPVEGQDSS